MSPLFRKYRTYCFRMCSAKMNVKISYPKETMPGFTIYSSARSPICDNTRSLLSKWAIPYREIQPDEDREVLREFSQKTREARMVPQILIDERWIGGFSELTELHMDGQLDALMENPKQ